MLGSLAHGLGNRSLRYLFEDFVLDTDRRELRRAGCILAVEPKVFDFLGYIIANRDHVVSKDDLIAAMWNAHRLGVGCDKLRQCRPQRDRR